MNYPQTIQLVLIRNQHTSLGARCVLTVILLNTLNFVLLNMALGKPEYVKSTSLIICVDLETTPGKVRSA